MALWKDRDFLYYYSMRNRIDMKNSESTNFLRALLTNIEVDKNKLFDAIKNYVCEEESLIRIYQYITNNMENIPQCVSDKGVCYIFNRYDVIDDSIYATYTDNKTVFFEEGAAEEYSGQNINSVPRYAFSEVKSAPYEVPVVLKVTREFSCSLRKWRELYKANLIQ
jgi:hypothetical protein